MVQLHESMKPVLVHNSQLDIKKVILKPINLNCGHPPMSLNPG